MQALTPPTSMELRHKKSAQIAMNKSFAKGFGQFKWNYYLLLQRGFYSLALGSRKFIASY